MNTARGRDLRTGAHTDRPLRRHVQVADRRRPRGHRVEGAARPDRNRTRRGGGRDPRTLLPQQRGARDRSCDRAGRGAAGDGSRHAGRPPLRIGSAGRDPGVPAGGNRQQRPRRRRRSREHEQRRLLLDRYALGRRPWRREGARRSRAGPHHGGWPPLSGAGRHAGDRRKPAQAVRHLARRAGRAGGVVAPARGGRAEGRHPRRGDRAGRGAQPAGRRAHRHRRASPGRHLGGIPEQAETRTAG